MMKSGDMFMPIWDLLKSVLSDNELNRTRVVTTYKDVFVTWHFPHKDIPGMNLRIRGALKKFVKMQGRTLRIKYQPEERPY